MRHLLTFSLLFCALLNEAHAASVSDYTLLGMKVVEMKQVDIRNTLFKWDGFTKPQASLNSKRFDRFYPVNILREAYRVEFRYELDGTFASLQIKYRPFNSEFNNQHQGSNIQAVVAQLTPMIGSPKARIRRTSPGLTDYNAYQWEDDNATLSVDLEDRQPGRPVVLTLRKKATTLATNYLP
ncbi:MAG: hypothetical protein JHC38_04940 [Thiotrichales bacterium]|jgi:hypothetical protein|nr:hypothetical protein [Thiotrichales bacterium]